MPRGNCLRCRVGRFLEAAQPRHHLHPMFGAEYRPTGWVLKPMLSLAPEPARGPPMLQAPPRKSEVQLTPPPCSRACPAAPHADCRDQFALRHRSEAAPPGQTAPPYLPHAWTGVRTSWQCRRRPTPGEPWHALGPHPHPCPATPVCFAHRDRWCRRLCQKQQTTGVLRRHPPAFPRAVQFFPWPVRFKNSSASQARCEVPQGVTRHAKAQHQCLHLHRRQI